MKRNLLMYKQAAKIKFSRYPDVISLYYMLSKCKAFAINIVNPPDVLSTDLPIKMFTDDEVLRYLGAEIRIEGKVSHVKILDLVSKRCEALLQFPHLHNWQKLAVCRMFITSLLPYPAQTDFNLNVHKSKDLLDAVRAINLLLQSIFDLRGIHRGFIVGSKLGGIGFPNPVWIIAGNAVVTAAYLEGSSDGQIQALAEINKLNFNDIIDDLCAHLSNSINPTPSSVLKEQLALISRDEKKMKLKRITENLQVSSIETWSSTTSGNIAGITIFKKSRTSSAFVRRPECLSNAEFNAAIRLRSGVPDLRCLSHIARKHGTDKCRLCKTVKESLGHVMGGCGALSGLITNRHDEALNLIFIELKTRNPEWTFELEPRPAVNVANHKPDLCATHRQSQSVVIMDFTVRTESTSQLIAEAKSDKINKYEQLRSFYMDNGARAFQVMPLFFGARGAIDDETETFLIKKFNLNKNCLEDICIYILKRSLHFYFKPPGGVTKMEGICMALYRGESCIRTLFWLLLIVTHPSASPVQNNNLFTLICFSSNLFTDLDTVLIRVFFLVTLEKSPFKTSVVFTCPTEFLLTTGNREYRALDIDKDEDFPYINRNLYILRVRPSFLYLLVSTLAKSMPSLAIKFKKIVSLLMKHLMAKLLMKEDKAPVKQINKFNSEANSRRINMVESCFGSSGQPSFTISLFNLRLYII
ncbi:hypothetical protein GQR58_019097 [Nymphon striatum]|nr:hypothetical protein GQR58_019097 [Nymphon striatum]